MAAISRAQLLHHPSTFFSRLPYSHSPFSINTRRRKFSFSSLSCTSASASSASTNLPIVGDLLNYLNESWTQFHATAEAKRQVIAAGFHLLSENDEWDLKPGGRYFFTRNMSCLVAFAVGENYIVGNGFHVIAAHTDSPCLKLKPKSASLKSNYLMLNVQTYGGGLWHTWFDRDLSVAGRVIVRASDGSFVHKLVKIKRPLLRVPTLAIHLDRTVNTDGFKPNLETHLVPLLATKPEEAPAESKEQGTSSSKGAHHPVLMQILSDELGCDVDDIVNIELNICDTQPSCLGGANNEFIFSGRLDNLASSYCALRALVDSCGSPGDLSSEHAIRMVALFDNEEVRIHIKEQGHQLCFRQ
ncbi:Aspartyl aminopeptidase [Hibiscus syriacus]|uniref:aspartyl aminopeptidase n=1 Tax=Hibiscus syriacus TaxID=106335 RepID=A0A6A2YJI8_HIBSY|nr:Aspartyl aminopeptidase [Hibiscus syriacus]